MLKCTPYIKDMCKNINTTFFNGEGEEGKDEEEEDNGESAGSSGIKPTTTSKQTVMVQLTDLKSSSTKGFCFHYFQKKRTVNRKRK